MKKTNRIDMHNKAAEWIVFNGAMDLENTGGGIQTAQNVSWHNRKSPQKTTRNVVAASIELKRVFFCF